MSINMLQAAYHLHSYNLMHAVFSSIFNSCSKPYTNIGTVFGYSLTLGDFDCSFYLEGKE